MMDVLAASDNMAEELILIVEDDERTRKLIRDVLVFHGYRTLEASTGELGLELARREQPRLILMDIRLPGIDGVEALRQLRSDATTARIPVLAVTASVMRGDEHRFLDAGFDGFIGKPLNVVELPQTVRSHLSPVES
jgi:two-component system cell cycle response regulator DivK